MIFFWAVSRFGAGLGAMISYIVPIAALILAFLVLGERPLPLQGAGRWIDVSSEATEVHRIGHALSMCVCVP